MRAIDVRMNIVEAEPATRNIRRLFVEMRCRDLRDLAPRSGFFGRDVGPILPAVACDPKLAIVGAGPQSVHGLKGRRERIDDAALFFGALGNERADAGGYSRILPRQVRADGLPRIAAIGGFEKHVAREIENVRVY